MQERKRPDIPLVLATATKIKTVGPLRPAAFNFRRLWRKIVISKLYVALILHPSPSHVSTLEYFQKKVKRKNVFFTNNFTLAKKYVIILFVWLLRIA